MTSTVPSFLSNLSPSAESVLVNVRYLPSYQSPKSPGMMSSLPWILSTKPRAKLQILSHRTNWSFTVESNLTRSTNHHLQSASAYRKSISVPLPYSTECRLQSFPECPDITSESFSSPIGANHSSKTFCDPGEVASDDSSGCCCTAP